jgi:hypothetical protein
LDEIHDTAVDTYVPKNKTYHSHTDRHLRKMPHTTYVRSNSIGIGDAANYRSSDSIWGSPKSLVECRAVDWLLFRMMIYL